MRPPPRWMSRGLSPHSTSIGSFATVYLAPDVDADALVKELAADEAIAAGTAGRAVTKPAARSRRPAQ